MSNENEKKYDFEETDRVMAELKARLASDAAAAATPISPEHCQNETPIDGEEKSTVQITTAENVRETENTPCEEHVTAPTTQEDIAAAVPTKPMSAEDEAISVADRTGEEAGLREKPPLQELSYARRGNVFAPFGFSGAQPAEEKKVTGETSVEKPTSASVKDDAPAENAVSAEEKPSRENRVFAPFGLKDTKIEATGLRAKAEAERAAKEVADAERAAREAERALERQKAAEEAHKAEVITPTEVDYKERGRVFAPFGFDRNAGKKASVPVAPTLEEEKNEAPAEGGVAPVEAVEPSAAPHTVPSATFPEITEGDWVHAPQKRDRKEKQVAHTERGNIRSKEQSESSVDERGSKNGEKAADVDRRSHNNVRKNIKVEKGRKTPPVKPGTEQTARSGGGVRSAEESVTLQCGGQTVVIPRDATGATAKSANNFNAAGALFSSLSVTRPKGESAKPRGLAAKATAEQVAFKRSVESSEEDFRLLLDLDYEKELGTAIGYEKIREYHERGLNGGRKESGKKQRGKKFFEYATHDQDGIVNQNYAKKRRRLRWNLAISAVLLILLFIYERPFVMHRWFVEQGVTGYPWMYVLLGLLIFTFGLLPLRRQLVEGFMQMVRLAPTDHSLCSVTVVLTYLYHFVLFFLPREGELTLYLSPAACSMMLLSLASLMDAYRESAAFRVVSEHQQKYALLSRVSVANRDGGAADRLKRPEPKGETYYVRPVDFVRNYFSNTENKPTHNSFFGSLLLLILAMGVSFALYATAMGAGVRTAVHTAFVTMMLCLPALSVLITALPMCFASTLRLKKQSAIIGEEAIYHRRENVSLVLPEHEVFLPMPHEQFELRPGADAEWNLPLIRALLDRLESPLAESVSVPVTERLSPSAVTLTEIAETGVSAVIRHKEGRVTVLFGGVDYMEKYGIGVSVGEEESDDFCKRLLCVAVEGQLTAVFLARYRLHEEILPLLKILAAEDASLVVRTKDPGVHGALMETLCAGAAGIIGVSKPLVGELELRCDRVDATIVALGSRRQVLRTYAVCCRVRRAGGFGGVLQILSTVVGVIGCGALTFFGLAARVPSFAVTLYMLFWCGLHALASYLYVREK